MPEPVSYDGLSLHWASHPDVAYPYHTTYGGQVLHAAWQRPD